MLEVKWTSCNHGWQKIAVLELQAELPKFGQTWDLVTWLTTVKRQIRGWGLSQQWTFVCLSCLVKILRVPPQKHQVQQAAMNWPMYPKNWCGLRRHKMLRSCWKQVASECWDKCMMPDRLWNLRHFIFSPFRAHRCLTWDFPLSLFCLPPIQCQPSQTLFLSTGPRCILLHQQ